MLGTPLSGAGLPILNLQFPSTIPLNGLAFAGRRQTEASTLSFEALGQG
jgi:hypothetical protein